MIVKFKEWLEAHDFRSMDPYDQVDLLAHRDEVNDKDTYYRYISEILYKLYNDTKELGELLSGNSHYGQNSPIFFRITSVRNSVLRCIRSLEHSKDLSDVLLIYQLKDVFKTILSAHKDIKTIQNFDPDIGDKGQSRIKELASNIEEGMRGLRNVKFLTSVLPKSAGMKSDMLVQAKLSNLERTINRLGNQGNGELTSANVDLAPRLRKIISYFAYGNLLDRSINLRKMIKTMRQKISRYSPEVTGAYEPIIRELESLL